MRSWFQSLTPDWKSWMRRYYLNFLVSVEQNWLGLTWKQDRSAEYAVQSFRQTGHTREAPSQFLQRRLLFARLLYPQLTWGSEAIKWQVTIPDFCMLYHSRHTEPSEG